MTGIVDNLMMVGHTIDMLQGEGAETPANRIATAQATLGLAVRINAAVLERTIVPAGIYAKPIRIVTGGPGLHLPASPESTERDLYLGTLNFVILALGASALILDETLDEVFGKGRADADPEREGLRIMVNQLRNAFAHNPYRAKWTIFERFRRRHRVILGGRGEYWFDATALHGNQVKPEDVGGLETWVKVLQHCEDLVA